MHDAWKEFSKHWGSDCQKATCCFAHSEKDRNAALRVLQVCSLWRQIQELRCKAAARYSFHSASRGARLGRSLDVLTLCKYKPRMGHEEKLPPPTVSWSWTTYVWKDKIEKHQILEQAHHDLVKFRCTGLTCNFLWCLHLTDIHHYTCIQGQFIHTSRVHVPNFAETSIHRTREVRKM